MVLGALEDLVDQEVLGHHQHRIHLWVLEYRYFLLVQVVPCRQVHLYRLGGLEVRESNLHFQ